MNVLRTVNAACSCVVCLALTVAVVGEEPWPVQPLMQPHRQRLRFEVKLVDPAPYPYQAVRLHTQIKNVGDIPLGPLASPGGDLYSLSVPGGSIRRPIYSPFLRELQERQSFHELGKKWYLAPLWLGISEVAERTSSYSAVWMPRNEPEPLFDRPGKYVLKIGYPNSKWITVNVEINVLTPPESDLPIILELQKSEPLRRAILSKEWAPTANVVIQLEAIVDKHPRSTYADYAWFALARAALADDDNAKARTLLKKIDAEHFPHGPQVLLQLRALLSPDETEEREAINEMLARRFPHAAEIEAEKANALTADDWQALREAMLTPHVPEGTKEIHPAWHWRAGAGRVQAIAISSDAKSLATATGRNGFIRFWDWNKKQWREQVYKHRGDITSLAFTADGKTLLSGGRDKTVRYWNVEQQEELARIDCPGEVLAVAIDPTGERLATALASRPTDVIVWDLVERTKALELQVHKDPARTVALSPDGRWLGSASFDGTAVLTPLFDENAKPKVMRREDAYMICSAFSPDGKLFATGSVVGEICLWSVETGELVALLRGHKRDVWWLAFSPDGKYLATCGPDRCAKLWSVDDKREVATLHPTEKTGIWRIAFTPDGNRLLGGGLNGMLYEWELELDQPAR